MKLSVGRAVVSQLQRRGGGRVNLKSEGRKFVTTGVYVHGLLF